MTLWCLTSWLHAREHAHAGIMLACSQVTTAAAIPSTIPSSIPRTREERFSQVDGTTWNVGLPPRFIIRRSHAGRRSPSMWWCWPGGPGVAQHRLCDNVLRQTRGRRSCTSCDSYRLCERKKGLSRDAGPAEEYARTWERTEQTVDPIHG